LPLLEYNVGPDASLHAVCPKPSRGFKGATS
jgi:hypothetical protein